MHCSKKVLITGATGLIGKEAIEPLEALGFEVYSKRFDLFDKTAIEEVFKNERPNYLLHFAWDTQPGYLESDLNYKFLDASLNMLEIFARFGGKRAIFAGTCFELTPETVYAKCKNELNERAQAYAAQNNISFGWGRIFYCMGHNENPNRLLPSVVNSLKSGQKIIIKSGPLIKDYMYTKDIAAAFANFLDTNVEGCVNICTGEGVSIKDFVLKLAAGKEDLIEFQDDCDGQPPIIIGDNTRLLNEVGYEIQYTPDKALKEILNEN
jgi:nucleoside-diphosphate-sugar epimerase